MNVMPKGDFYVWYCDWCDSRNMTIWTKVDTDRFCCNACQKANTIEADHNSGLEFDNFLLQAV
jgi:hypothetical protein